MRFFKMIDRWLLQRWPRYRLWRICKAIGIKPHKWQKWFALGEFNYLPPQIREERCSGKTTAILLRILMIAENNPDAWALAGRVLQIDPDFNDQRIRIYSSIYRIVKNRCLDAGIPVLQVEPYRMIIEYHRVYR